MAQARAPPSWNDMYGVITTVGASEARVNAEMLQQM